MAYMFAQPTGLAVSAIVLGAVRCWRKARDAGYSLQPSLIAILRDHDCEMLAPCFDSLMAFSEAALGRSLCVGKDHIISEDEHLLLDLLTGTKWTAVCFVCSDGIAAALDCALRSMRIMMGIIVPISPKCGPTVTGAQRTKPL
ncbi:hypothetical protein D3Y57_02925 (plasmid) [Sphingomonas paeninsulae]|uniref:Uncharacterized protein n=1 Tax=Sphingomonas paeninsulae TaxID=2319844 RepID=A0A494TGN9_SPHPE|nr:hypothetical protein [Sphingomonas paeninsulae]AYJ85016.1 hypothetical protein D3Y57_02925 [Sphingomonas paeninsulae]